MAEVIIELILEFLIDELQKAMMPDVFDDGWEDAVREDDVSRYTSNDVWDDFDVNKGPDPDPNLLKNSVSSEGRRWPYVVMLDRCDVCGRFKGADDTCDCTASVREETVDDSDNPPIMETARDHKPWNTYVDRCERCGRFISKVNPHDCPLDRDIDDIPEITQQADEFTDIPPFDYDDGSVAFSDEATVFDPDPPLLTDVNNTEGDLSRLRAELDEVDDTSELDDIIASLRIIDYVLYDKGDFWERLRDAIHDQAANQWAFIGDGVNDWTLAAGQRYITDLFPIVGYNITEPVPDGVKFEDEGDFWDELREDIHYQASHQWTFTGRGFMNIETEAIEELTEEVMAELLASLAFPELEEVV